MSRIPYAEMRDVFKKILASRGFDETAALEAATIFTDNSCAGVYSHGLNRFPRVVHYLDNGSIDPTKVLTLEQSFGAIERWNGHQGFGPLNAKRAMGRACELAKANGVGAVALGNNNHWMRGGTYGEQAANQGLIAICWSNTMPNMPAWGGVDKKIGNNPLVIAVPCEDGAHVVCDCAMSQFSYGKIEECRLKGIELPENGGYNAAGALTKNPAEIEETKRVLPMGFWKGSGLSLVLDVIGAILSNGNATKDIGTFGDEVGLTQIFIVIDSLKFNSEEMMQEIVESILADFHTSTLIDENSPVRYPGERAFKTRTENLEKGIPVIEEKWNEVLSFLPENK